MKKLAIYLLMCLFTATNFACTPKVNRSKENVTPKTTETILVYYFHFSIRCSTCIAVENITNEALTDYFYDEIKNKKIVFKSINMDEQKGEELAEKYKIAGQTLVIISGDKKINLTNQAFMYAGTRPEKLKNLLQEKINNLM